MAVAYSNSTESIRTDTSTTYSWSHTPAATPRGVVVTAAHDGNSTDYITGVTYGGQPLTRIATAEDTAGEPGRSYLYFLGSGIPTGAQTVQVTLNTATGNDIHFVVATLTGAADLEVVDFATVPGDNTSPSVTMLVGGRLSVAVGVLYSGLAAPANATPNADMSASQDHDFGNFMARFDRQTTPSTSDFTFSYSSSNDDVALTVASISEVQAAAPVSGSGALTARAATLSGTGKLSFSGSGAVAPPAASLTGTATLGFRASGALAAPPAGISGTGSLAFRGSGALMAPAPTSTGAGSVTSTGIVGSGDLIAPAPTLSGAGAQAFRGTGALAAAPATLLGVGAVGSNAIVGSGALIAPAATLAGTGAVGVAGVDGTVTLSDEAAFGATPVVSAYNSATVSDENYFSATVSDEL